jgi:hypothetical protein
MDDLQVLKDLLPFLIPVFLLELGLMIWALIDVVKRKRVTGGNKLVWILIIVLVNIIGPIIYLLIGRKEDSGNGEEDAKH